MMKKILAAFLPVLFILSMSACAYMDSLREASYKFFPDDIIERMPVWLVENGKERQSEIRSTVKPVLTEYFSNKYGECVVIKTWHYMTSLEGRPEGAGTGFLPAYEYYAPVYNGQVVVICELNGREFTGYVDVNSLVCYDNYQRDEIEDAIDVYIRSVVGSEPVDFDITIDSPVRFSTVQKYDIVVPITYIMSDYSIPSFFDDGYFKYTFPYCNTVPVSDFSVDADYEKLDENLWRWVRTEKISMSEEIDGVMTHWVEEYNIPVRISDVYVQPNDFVGYIDLDNIPDYDVSKTYQVCKYNCDNNDYIVEDVEVINGEYVFIDYDFDVEYWFLIEVTNVIESRDSGDSNDDVEQTLDELAGDDGDIDLSDPETAVKFFLGSSQV